LNYIDIHTHSYYQNPDTTLVLNVFPEEKEKLQLHAYFSVGLHPWHIRESTLERQINLVGIAAGSQNVLALGETGLDKVIRIPYTLQCAAFEQQLAIAEAVHKPVVIHCVRSYSELLAYRKKSDQSIPWIFHWFNSGEQTAAELIRKNCLLSFGHMLFNEQSKAYGTFIHLPLEKVFLETDDAGYTIGEVYEKAALIRNIPLEELKRKIMDNFVRCFNRM
jgi:TatD DNase family protein